MKILEDIHDFDSRLTVQVTGRLIGKDDRRLRSNCSGYSNTLLLSTGKLVWSVIHTVFQSNFRQCFPGNLFSLLLSKSAVDQWKFYISKCIQVWNQIESLKDEANLVIADIRQFIV